MEIVYIGFGTNKKEFEVYTLVVPKPGTCTWALPG